MSEETKVAPPNYRDAPCCAMCRHQWSSMFDVDGMICFKSKTAPPPMRKDYGKDFTHAWREAYRKWEATCARVWEHSVCDWFEAEA